MFALRRHLEFAIRHPAGNGTCNPMRATQASTSQRFIGILIRLIRISIQQRRESETNEA
jgi:hypothetical protein